MCYTNRRILYFTLLYTGQCQTSTEESHTALATIRAIQTLYLIHIQQAPQYLINSVSSLHSRRQIQAEVN